MTYKKSTTFGTSCGGCCSLIANILLLFYVVVMAIGFFVSPGYNVSEERKYYPLYAPELYDIHAADLVPALGVRVDEEYAPDHSMLKITYTQTNIEGGGVSRPPITCDKYAEKYLKPVVDEGVITSFNHELFAHPEKFLCPDFEFIKVMDDDTLTPAFILKIELSDAY